MWDATWHMLIGSLGSNSSYIFQFSCWQSSKQIYMNIGMDNANPDPVLEFPVNDNGKGLAVNEGGANVDNDNDDNDCDVDGPTVEAFVDLVKTAHKYCSN
jgi:hypothetical protein